MSKNIIEKEKAEEICKRVFTVADFCREVGWKPVGNNYRIFYKYVKEYNLDTSHFTGKKTNIGNKNNNGISDKEYFKRSKLIKGSELLKRLIKNQLKEYKCENPECGLSEWHGKPIKLQIHHIDGDHFNNELSNLIILCPNCHSQTENFAGNKNRRGICTHVHKREYKNKCSVCGKPLRTKRKTGMCIQCLRETRKKEHIN